MADWDLYAIVRSCTPPAVNTSSSNTNTTTDNTIENGNSDNYLDCLASLTFEDDDDPFSFPNFIQARNNGWQELQDSYKPFLPSSSATVQGNIPLSSVYDYGQFCGQNQPQLAQQQQAPPPPPPPLLLQAAQPPTLTPHTNTPFISLHFNNIQQQLQHAHQPQHQQNPQRAKTTAPVLPLRTSQSPLSRSRKKKSNIKRQVMQVTAENLCNDVWAWRKYGQKPIKGSPYPRNYYRCSSSKGCGARKQVERSNTDPSLFIVSYTGDHTHPRPTHRNSLAGSTRNKFPILHKPEAAAIKESNESEKAPCSSPLSGTSLSPTTPLSASMDHETAAANENIKPEDGADTEGHRIESDGYNNDEDEYDDDNILIPNMTLNEDLIKGLQELGCSTGESSFGGVGNSTRTGGLGRGPDFGGNFSSWSVGSSAAAAGGGDR